MATIGSPRAEIGICRGDFEKIAASRPVSTVSKARIGFIGGGWWATTNHMPLLRARKDVQLVSVCGLDAELNSRIKGDFGFLHATTNFMELLEQRLDGVVVATPHSLHARHAMAALEAGCHAMVEKPMTTSTADARNLVRVAREKRLHLMVPYGWHYLPMTMQAKELLDGKCLGRIECVACQMASPSKMLFTGASFDYADQSYLPPAFSTYTDPVLSEGGYGQGQLSHAAGLVAWLTGLQADSVYAEMSSVGSGIDLYNSLSVRFKGGAIGTFSGAATVPAGGRFQLDIRIFGSDGVMLFDIERERLEVIRHGGEHWSRPVAPGEGTYRCDQPPHEFVELILGLSDENHAPGEIGLSAVEIIDAAYRSFRSGKSERVPEDAPAVASG
jgi:predicted dehydrogenase